MSNNFILSFLFKENIFFYFHCRFHRGKFFRYNEAAKDVNGVVSFAMYKFKEQRGHRVPEPPTALEHFYEHFRERLTDAIVCLKFYLFMLNYVREIDCNAFVKK